MVTLCHECHEKVHKRQDFIDSLHGGSFFYHIWHQGVGIVRWIYDNYIWFTVCWTERRPNRGDNHGRLYVEDEASFTDIREASNLEIKTFLDNVVRYCHDYEILYYFYCYIDLLPEDHPIVQRITHIRESGKYYNDDSPQHHELAKKLFEKYLIENKILNGNYHIELIRSSYNPFYQRYEITIVYSIPNEQGLFVVDREIDGVVLFSDMNDGTYQIIIDEKRSDSNK